MMHGKENANPNHPYLFGHAKPGKEGRAGERVREGVSCPVHQEEMGRLFCQECLRYDLCSRCLPDHEGHVVRRFASWSEAKEETKEALLLAVEDTLNRLKGRDNELKNQVEEISLIKQRLRSLSDEVIATVRLQLNQLEQRVHEKLRVEFDRYERELDAFYREYNAVNDYLRDNLLQIIDGEIDLPTFSRAKVSRDIEAGAMPQFGRVKLVMEKCKKHLRGVRESTRELEHAIRFFSNEEEKTLIKFEKYDRFLKDKSLPHDAPLLRTLHILEQHPDLALLRAKVRT